MGLQSPLGKAVAPSPKTDAEVRATCRDAWHRDGTICLRLDWMNNWPDRKQLEMLAEKTFGKRQGTRR